MVGALAAQMAQLSVCPTTRPVGVVTLKRSVYGAKFLLQHALCSICNLTFFRSFKSVLGCS
jgi:hypothetical protein